MMFVKVLISLALGAIAGAIDVIPMRNSGVPKFSLQYIFATWVFLGLIIPFVDWPIHPAFIGMIVGVLGMTPIAIIAKARRPKAIPGILFYGLWLGTALGLASNWLFEQL
jgi:hypothetical protein